MDFFKILPTILFFFLAGEIISAEEIKSVDEKPMERLNPFDLPRGVYSKDNIPKETPQTLKLEAIITLKGRKVATISGQNYIEGDFIGGKRVTRIFKNRVTLDDAGKEENLVLDARPFSLRKQMHN